MRFRRVVDGQHSHQSAYCTGSMENGSTDSSWRMTLYTRAADQDQIGVLGNKIFVYGPEPDVIEVERRRQGAIIIQTSQGQHLAGRKDC